MSQQLGDADRPARRWNCRYDTTFLQAMLGLVGGATPTYQVATSTKVREALAINPVPMMSGMMETGVSS